MVKCGEFETCGFKYCHLYLPDALWQVDGNGHGRNVAESVERSTAVLRWSRLQKRW